MYKAHVKNVSRTRLVSGNLAGLGFRVLQHVDDIVSPHLDAATSPDECLV